MLIRKRPITTVEQLTDAELDSIVALANEHWRQVLLKLTTDPDLLTPLMVCTIIRAYLAVISPEGKLNDRTRTEPDEPGQVQPIQASAIEIRLKGPAGPVLAATTRLKLSLNVLAESEDCPNRTGTEVRRYLKIEPVGDYPSRCTIRLSSTGVAGTGQNSAEPHLVICGEISLRQIGDLIAALINTAVRFEESEPYEDCLGQNGPRRP